VIFKRFVRLCLQSQQFVEHLLQHVEIEGAVVLVIAVSGPPGQQSLRLADAGVRAVLGENLLGGVRERPVPGERRLALLQLVAHHNSRQQAVLFARHLDVPG